MGLYDTPPDTTPRSLIGDRPQLPYLLPFLGYGLVMSIKALPNIAGIDFAALAHTYHPVEYTLRSVVAVILMWYFWKYYTKIRWTHLPLGFLVGLIGVPLWILTEYGMQWILLHPLGSLHWFKPLTDADMTYIPIKEITNLNLLILFYIVRVGLPTFVVPVMEELFWRDFMMRALVRGARFQEIAVGTFTWTSLIGMSLMFSVIHFQHVAAILWALMIGTLLIRTKSLGACIVAHGTTNLFLYLYVIYSHDWQFW